MPVTKRKEDEGNSRSKTDPPTPHSKACERAGGTHLTDGCIELYSGNILFTCTHTHKQQNYMAKKAGFILLCIKM